MKISLLNRIGLLKTDMIAGTVARTNTISQLVKGWKWLEE